MATLSTSTTDSTEDEDDYEQSYDYSFLDVSTGNDVIVCGNIGDEDSFVSSELLNDSLNDSPSPLEPDLLHVDDNNNDDDNNENSDNTQINNNADLENVNNNNDNNNNNNNNSNDNNNDSDLNSDNNDKNDRSDLNRNDNDNNNDRSDLNSDDNNDNELNKHHEDNNASYAVVNDKTNEDNNEEEKYRSDPEQKIIIDNIKDDIKSNNDRDNTIDDDNNNNEEGTSYASYEDNVTDIKSAIYNYDSLDEDKIGESIYRTLQDILKSIKPKWFDRNNHHRSDNNNNGNISKNNNTQREKSNCDCGKLNKILRQLQVLDSKIDRHHVETAARLKNLENSVYALNYLREHILTNKNNNNNNDNNNNGKTGKITERKKSIPKEKQKVAKKIELKLASLFNVNLNNETCHSLNTLLLNDYHTQIIKEVPFTENSNVFDENSLVVICCTFVTMRSPSSRTLVELFNREMFKNCRKLLCCIFSIGISEYEKSVILKSCPSVDLVYFDVDDSRVMLPSSDSAKINNTKIFGSINRTNKSS